MKSFSPNVDEILRRALISAFLGILGFSVLSYALSSLGFTVNDNYIFFGMMIYNLIPTWHIIRSVKMLGKNPWIYGGLSILGIPFSIFAVSMLMLPREFKFIKHILKNRGK